MPSMKEKFQVTAPKAGKDDPGPWQTVDTVRVKQEDDWAPNHMTDYDNRRFNNMPPGMELDQDIADIRRMPMSLAGETDQSKDTNNESLRDGFKVRPMKSTDEVYTGEHIDLFYGDNGGFAERNNYLDRF